MKQITRLTAGLALILFLMAGKNTASEELTITLAQEDISHFESSTLVLSPEGIAKCGVYDLLPNAKHLYIACADLTLLIMDSSVSYFPSDIPIVMFSPNWQQDGKLFIQIDQLETNIKQNIIAYLTKCLANTD